MFKLVHISLDNVSFAYLDLIKKKKKQPLNMWHPLLISTSFPSLCPCFIAQVTGNSALFFRHGDGPDLALHQLSPQHKDAHTAIGHLPDSDTLTLLQLKKARGNVRKLPGEVV